MRQTLTQEEWDLLSETSKAMIYDWQLRNGYIPHWNLTIGEIMHLYKDFGNRYYKDQPIEHFSYEHMLLGQDSVVCWDGAEFINTFWWEFVERVDR